MLGHDVAMALHEMRAHAESLMLDHGTAWRPTGETAYDPGAQARVPVFVELFSSRCKVKDRVMSSVEEQVGGRTVVTTRPALHLPTSTPALQAGDEWRMASVDVLSAVSASSVFTVQAPFDKSLATARRYDIEEQVT